MNNFCFVPTDLKDAYLIQCAYSKDKRGGFTKLFEKEIFSNGGLNFEISETFISVSAKDVIRGMHFQLYHPQEKIVSVLQGKVFDVIVDLRSCSKTFRQWQGFELSGENGLALYIPKGFAHGFLTMENDTVMLYQCEGQYDKATDTGIRFDDPDINILWPAENVENTIHSERDLGLMSFKEFSGKEFIY